MSNQQTALLIPEPQTAIQPPTPLSLIRDALAAKVAPEVLKELVSLQQSMVRFEWEAQERQSRIGFDDALSNCQKHIGRIAPNQKRNDTSAWWADYAQLDRHIRPIYTADGFSISFSEVAPINPNKIRIMATLARGGISREYFSEITPSTTGAKGNALVNATDADAIAQSRAKRYLLLDIFNIAVGIDKEEKLLMNEGAFTEWIDNIKTSANEEELKKRYFEALAVAKKVGDSFAETKFAEAKNAWFLNRRRVVQK